MSQRIDLTDLARQIQSAQDNAQQMAPFTSRFSDFDVPAAYAVAGLVHKARMRQGARPAGRKIGFTNPDMWALYGVQEPIWAYMYDTTVVYSNGEPQTCSLTSFAEPKIEPEIVFHFSRAPVAGMTKEAILECIDWVALGFEIVQSHFPGWKFQAADTVADWGLHGRLLVGAPQPVANLGPAPIAVLKDFSLALSCDGQLRETGAGFHVLGSPLLAISHLVSVLAKQPNYLPIQENELVTTGTITTAHSVRAGETWHARPEGIALAGLAVEFTR